MTLSTTVSRTRQLVYPVLYECLQEFLSEGRPWGPVQQYHGLDLAYGSCVYKDVSAKNVYDVMYNNLKAERLVRYGTNSFKDFPAKDFSNAVCHSLTDETVGLCIIKSVEDFSAKDVTDVTYNNLKDLTTYISTRIKGDSRHWRHV